MNLRYNFGNYVLDVEGRQVSLGGRTLSLTPKAFDLLVLLAESQGRVISRDELIQELWSEEFVEEANLSFQMSALRRALGDEGAKYIETVPKHGYRFNCPVFSAASNEAVEFSGSRPLRRRNLVPVASLALIGLAGAITWVSLRGKSHSSTDGRNASIRPLTSYPGNVVQPTLSPEGTQVAFSWDGPDQDNYDIYVKLVGPGEPMRLTTNAAADLHPAWSPDGQYIAFLRYSREDTASIFLIPALGGAERKLVDVNTLPFRPRGGSRNLSWSSNGKYLALGCGTDRDIGSSIWAIDVSTGERRRLTAVPENENDYSPVFARDDGWVAFIRGPRPNLADIYIQRLTNALRPRGEAIRISFDVAMIFGLARIPEENKLIYSMAPRLGFPLLRAVSIGAQGGGHAPSPVDLRLGDGVTALSIARGRRMVYGRTVADSNIWTMQVSRHRASIPKRLIASTFSDHAPDYSPDGERLAFASTRSGSEEIWIAEADGSRPSQLTNRHGPQTSNPRWSADGKKILFNSWNRMQSDLWLVTVRDGQVQLLTSDPGNDVEPRWSRDGKWIYFSSDKSGRYEIYRMPANGGTAVRMTRDGGINATESADGLLLYYAKTPHSPTAIWRLPVAGGKEEKVIDGLSYSLNFAVADKGIYFISVGDRETKTALEFFDFNTAKQKRLRGLDEPWFYGMAMSPQQDVICYSIVDHTGSNLMLVDGMN
jgi:Tol biopolymer transport system component/DNA-binding winged helix-turn-helix (wHTH) protein